MAVSRSHHDDGALQPDNGAPPQPPSLSAATRDRRIHSLISNSFLYLAGDEEDDGGQKVDDSIFDDISLTPRSSVGAACGQPQPQLPPPGAERLAMLLRALVTGGAAMTMLVGYKGSVSVQAFLLGNSRLDDIARLLYLLASVLSALILTAPVIRWLGCKWTFAASILLYAPYSAAQYLPTYYMLLPAAALSGLCSSLLLCSRGLYLCQLAHLHAGYTHRPLHVSLVACFSAFYAVFNLAEFWDSLITTIALPPTRTTWFPCSENISIALYESTAVQTLILNGVYTSLVLVAFLMAAIGLSSLHRNDKTPRAVEDGGDVSAGLFVMSITGLRECKRLLLLVPLLLFLGVHRAYFIEEYIQNYVSCELGLDYVVNALMCLGATSSVAALVTASLAAHVSSLVVTTASALTNIAALITLLAWRPQQSDGFVVYVLAALGGTTTGVLNIHLQVICGELVPGYEVVAYSHVALWHSLSHLLATGVSSYLALSAKLYTMVLLLAGGSVSYIIAELSRRKV